MTQFNMADLKKRMNGALEVLRKEFAGLRTGRASASRPRLPPTRYCGVPAGRAKLGASR